MPQLGLRCHAMKRTRHDPISGRISLCAALVPRSLSTDLQCDTVLVLQGVVMLLPP